MDSRLLIDAIVKQTTVLIASLSTAAGIRAPLAHVADQVFLDLAGEIEAQGVGRKVVADMFGLALRTYQRKVQRLSESVSERNRSLWEAVFQFIVESEQVSRRQVEERFRQDLPEDVAAVLNDLVRNGLVFAAGHGKSALYRPVAAPGESASAGPDSRDQATGPDPGDADSLANLVWASVYRRHANTLEQLSRALGVPRERVEGAVSRLVEDGRVKQDAKGAGNGNGSLLTAASLLVPVGASQGWEAAVFDHYSTVAAAIAAKVNQGPGSQADDVVGGATLCFEIHADHPHWKDVHGLLKRIRAEVNELWDRVESHNRTHPAPEEALERVHFYFGQYAEQKDAPLSGKNA
jgi:hypothetical protein